MIKTISVQSVLYEPESESLRTFMECLAGLTVPEGYELTVRIGDCSKEPQEAGTAARWFSEFGDEGIKFTYEFFGENLGFGGGQNRLSELSTPDYILTLNPDTVFAPDLVTELVKFAEGRSDFGIVEARQFPLEHPKTWNKKDFTTPWCSGCCAMFSGEVYRTVRGFDPAFFLYCEDVDVSWRVRALGKRCYYCVEAGIYHRKQLTLSGVRTGESEHLWGLAGLLLLLKKYGRNRQFDRLLNNLKKSKDERYELCRGLIAQWSPTLTMATPAERRMARFYANFAPNKSRWGY